MVLAYHEIVPEDSSYSYSVRCDLFAQHLALMNELREPGCEPGGPPTRVTLDDGHITQYTHGLPLLEEFQVKGVFYVTAGWTGTQPDYMSITQLREIVSLGHEVQAHGWSHKMMTRCSPSELYEELHRSKSVLEDRLGVQVKGLSAPHGRWNDRVLEACASAGYEEVCISDPGVGPVDRLGIRLVGRLMVTRGMSAEFLRSFLKAERKVPAKIRVKDTLKRTVHAVIGERLYHKLWCFTARNQQPIPLVPAERPTRILQLISSEGYYGAESMLVNLVSSLNAAGYRNVVGVFRNEQNPHIEVAERARQKGLCVEVIPCAGRVDRTAIRTIRKTIYQQGIDVVHAHGFKANLYGALAGVPTGVPLVATYHLDWPDRGFSLYCYHLLDRMILHRFQKVIAVSEVIARSLRRWGLSHKKVATVANGIDMAPFLNLPLGIGSEAGATKIVIGLVGRLTPQKGHRYLLQAAPAIFDRFPKVEFQFFGNGYEREALLDMAISMGIADRVKFAGSRSDMAAVYASIDILVLPSINEGMPMTLIEGLAAGRAVVASRVGDVPKLIRHGETGLLVKPTDVNGLQAALIQLLSDAVLRDRLASNGRRWVQQHFSADAMARRYHELYEETLRRHAMA